VFGTLGPESVDTAVPGRGFTYTELDRFPVTEIATGQPTAGNSEPDPPLGLVVGETVHAAAEAVADEILRLLSGTTIRDKATGVERPARPADVAILFRSRESHREFEAALERRSVTTYVYKGLGFFEADEVQDVVALLRYLAEPTSSLRAAAFLRSRIVRLSDDAIRRLSPGIAGAIVEPTWGSAPHPGSVARGDPDAPRRSLAGAPCAPGTAMRPPERDQDPRKKPHSGPNAEVASLSAEDLQVLTKVRTSVARWLTWVDRMTPAELLDAVLEETAYYIEIRGPRRLQARENLKKFRGLVRRIQNRGYATLARIADHLERLAVGDESNATIDAIDAVSLMTVHAAKGLEFPIVFVVNVGRGTGAPRAPIRVTTANDGEPAVAVADFQSEADEEAQARDREETKRLLYVALTRARDRLYLAATVQGGACRPGRGSLGEVMPRSLINLFVEAAGSRERIVTWAPTEGRQYPMLALRERE
jgi:ATP-dependent helicase/nuclease subunit A